jgi:hypothetical protein
MSIPISPVSLALSWLAVALRLLLQSLSAFAHAQSFDGRLWNLSTGNLSATFIHFPTAPAQTVSSTASGSVAAVGECLLSTQLTRH